MNSDPFTCRAGAVRAVAAALAAASLLGACGGSGGNGAPTGASFLNNTATPQVFGVYQGVASTSVRFTDNLGQTQIRNYATPVQIEVAPPLRAPVGSQTELNPFHFSVRPVSSGIAEEGLYAILSASLLSQGAQPLLQHWRFNENGAAFSGTLTLPQHALNPTANVIYLPPDPAAGFTIPAPFGLETGTRLTGTLTADQISFRVEGNTIDGRHPFTSEVSATRIVQPLLQ